MMLSVYWSPILVSDFFSFQLLNRSLFLSVCVNHHLKRSVLVEHSL